MDLDCEAHSAFLFVSHYPIEYVQRGGNKRKSKRNQDQTEENNNDKTEKKNEIYTGSSVHMDEERGDRMSWKKYGNSII